MEFSRLACLLGLLIPYSVALQVTPNSPCSSFCIDSEGDDVSDPNSSTTTNKDITCYDSKYTSTPAGQKFQRCISCLQDSTFSQGEESDQLWFLYNLRYTFDNCIFGFPHAVGIPSTPCSTSTACGSLQNALTQDGLSSDSLDYSYCDVDGGVITSSELAKCTSCVGASEDQGFLVNYLIALEAGCNQRPEAGIAIGLTDTVFSATTISATKGSSKDSEDGQAALPTTTIVGIAVGASVVVLLAAGLFFVCFRKRRNRRLILEGGERSSSRHSHHRATSPLSFRCQARTPRSPDFFPNQLHSRVIDDDEKYCSNPHLALGSHRVTSDATTTGAPSAHWQPQKTAPPYSRPRAALQSLQNISTAPPTVPDNVHCSTSPKAARFSPHEETPISTTSTRSTSNLLPLRAYNPAEYGVSSPHIGSSIDGSFSSPTSGSTTSPLMSRLWEKQNPDSMSPIWEVPQRETVIMRSKGAGALDRIRVPTSPGKRKVSSSGSPVESKQINMSFPGPPSPGARWGRT
ncbi:hypothetical protein F5Y08DRAFT_67771 [Xylaria arbuscula]|nr:hypothetical protein F5Y08DRAFT_67771 [Xylaria arbuscula]